MDTLQSFKGLYEEDDMAIIGMAGRFPCANNLQEFWIKLVSGKETYVNGSKLDEILSLYVQMRNVGCIATLTKFTKYYMLYVQF